MTRPQRLTALLAEGWQVVDVLPLMGGLVVLTRITKERGREWCTVNSHGLTGVEVCGKSRIEFSATVAP